jgi:hypothetical protein
MSVISSDGQVLDSPQTLEAVEDSSTSLNFAGIAGDLSDVSYNEGSEDDPNLPPMKIAKEGGGCPNGQCGSRQRAGDDDGGGRVNPWDKNYARNDPTQFFNLMAAARNRGVQWPPLRMFG